MFTALHWGHVYIVDLECEQGHKFEGWYDSAAELRALEARGDVTCPLCEAPAHTVPTASRVSTSKTRHDDDRARAMTRVVPREPAATAPVKMPLEMQQALAKVIQHVQKTHEDVGPAFTERALAIHRGEEPPKLIRGQASEEQEAQLADEGVPFLKVPIPDIEQN